MKIYDIFKKNTFSVTSTFLVLYLPVVSWHFLVYCIIIQFNSMIANPDKFQIIFLGNKNNESFTLNVNNSVLENSKSIKLLGVVIDDKLSFLPHINDMCKKANQAIKGLLRLRKNLTQEKAELLCNAYILSRFNYCPLIWMFSGKKGANIINCTHKRALTAVTNDFSLSLDDLLLKTNSCPIHHRNLCTLLIEVYKSLNCLNPEFMWDVFLYKETYHNLRGGKSLIIPPIKSTIGLNSLVFRGSLGWNYLPRDIKESPTLTAFKTKLSKLTKIYCHCKICS